MTRLRYVKYTEAARDIYCNFYKLDKMFRILWEKKKKEEEDLLFRDLEELKELSRAKMFGR